MSLSLYDVSIPVFIRAFGNLSRNLAKARTFADESGMPHEELLNARLIEDMFPLTAQVQRASDTSRFVAVRVGQQEAVPMADNEASFDELQARIKATVDYLKAVPSDAFAGRETAEVDLQCRLPHAQFHRQGLCARLRHPEFLFPCHHGLRHPEAQGRAARQGRFPRRTVRSCDTAV